jgi:hypothetical protein
MLWLCVLNLVHFWSNENEVFQCVREIVRETIKNICELLEFKLYFF